MKHDDKTRYIGVASNGLTQEFSKRDALEALATGDAKTVLVMRGAEDHSVLLMQWTLCETAPCDA
jgi:hypothetical protein